MTASRPGHQAQLRSSALGRAVILLSSAMMDRELLLSIAATFTGSFICCGAATAEAFLITLVLEKGLQLTSNSEDRLAPAAYCCRSSPKLAASMSL